MLFSNETVAQFIQEHFEPAWQSVRPVPVVRIDFGGGNVVTRTLHGNVATYVCRADGIVLDILPGVYLPEVFQEQLDQALKLAEHVAQDGGAGTERLRDYHRRQAEALHAFGQAEVLRRVSRGLSISAGERDFKIVLAPARRLHARASAAAGQPLLSPAGSAPAARPSSADLLDEDTEINETVRRRLIHQYLAQHTPQTPASMTRWLYREVLRADLDDPYLGLGDLLQAGLGAERAAANGNE